METAVPSCGSELFQECLRKQTQRQLSQPTVSFYALRRAKTTLQDFVLSYFHWHDLSLEDVFEYLPILVYVEGTIYHMDEENEELTANGQDPGPDWQFSGWAPMLEVLRNQQLLDEQVLAELDNGKKYWMMERSICKRWLLGELVTLEEVMTCSALKSFDYRVLNLLMYKLTGRPYDQQVLDFLRIDEQLVDINDDLVDYCKDTHRNSFNVYRGFLFALGPTQGQLKLVETISQLENALDSALVELPAERVSAYKARQRGAMEHPSAEKWIIPTPIVEEHEFREQQLESTVNSSQQGDLEFQMLSSTSSSPSHSEDDTTV